MQVVTASTMLSDEREAVAALSREILKEGAEKIAGVCLFFQKSLSPAKLREACLEFFADIPFAGMSAENGSFDANALIGDKSGMMPSSGGASRNRFSVNRFKEPEIPRARGVIALAFTGEDVFLGTVAGVYSPDMDINPDNVFNRASAKAGFLGVFPDLILFHCTDDAQFPFASALAKHMGDSVQVAGGLFDTSDGDVAVFNEEQVITGKSLYLMTFLYTDCDVVVTGENNSEPEGYYGVVTEASGCIVSEIDNQPAADVLFRWLDQDSTSWSPDKLNQELSKVRLRWTLAACSADIRGSERFTFTYLSNVTPERAIQISHIWEPGERVCLMAVSGNDMVRYLCKIGHSSDRVILGTLHYICQFYSTGEMASRYFESVVPAVRSNKNYPFITMPQQGELVKSMDVLEYIMGNYMIVSVWFMEREAV